MSAGKTTASAGGGFGRVLHSGDMHQKLLAFASLIILVIGFSWFAGEKFYKVDSILAILQSASVNGVLAVGVTMVIITGGIDLSIGMMMTFCAIMTGVVLTWFGMPLPLGVLTALATGALCGAVSGTLVAWARIPPFIATLGMMLVLKGLSLIITGTRPIYFNSTDGYTEISQGSLVGMVFPGFALSNGVLIFFMIAGIVAFILGRTVLGRYTFALGSNEEAVRLSGVSADRWKIAIYTLTGCICGVAGLLLSSRINTAQPAMGAGYELEAIAAVVIGGTSLSGGKGTVLGTVIGVLIMSVLTFGLRVMSIAPEWQTVVIGVIIISAVAMDQLRRRSLS